MIPQSLLDFVIRLWILLSLFQGRDWVVKWQQKPTPSVSIWLSEHQRKKIKANNYDWESRNGLGNKGIGSDQMPLIPGTEWHQNWLGLLILMVWRPEKKSLLISLFVFLFSFFFFFVTVFYYYEISWLCALIFLAKSCIINMWMCSSNKMYIIFPSSRQCRESVYVFFSSRNMFA